MNRRRLSALMLLKRLKKYEMEKDARTLGDLRHSMVALDQQRQELVNGIRFKMPTYDANSIPYMQQYVPAAKAEILFIAAQMTQLEPSIATLEKLISEKFQEFKTFDILYDTLTAEMRREQDAHENAESEETTLWRWTQKQRAARKTKRTDNTT